MSGPHVDELLSAYLEDDLLMDQAGEIRRHLASCPECASLCEALAEAREVLASWPQLSPSPVFLRRLYAIPAKRRFRFSLDSLLRPTLQPILAGAMGVLVFISFLTFSATGKTYQKSLNRQVHTGYSNIERLYAKASVLTDELSDKKNIILSSLKDINILKKSRE